MNYEEYNKSYEKIAKLLWAIMPKEAEQYIFQCDIYHETTSYQMFWKDKNGIRKDYPIGEFPTVDINIINEYSKLKNIMSADGNCWTHSIFVLNDNGEFNIRFAYIPEEDSWNMLYMKGISDLTEEETKEYYIPLEVWRDRVNRKEEIYAKYTNLKGN